jgi:REP element-mobilizing transposase RayT
MLVVNFQDVYSHVIFAIKNSRYDLEKVKRKKPAGFIAPTFPFFEGKEEEDLIEILCNIAVELKIRIIAFNICGDHVHALIVNESPDLTKTMRLWKGKTSYLFNRRINLPVKNASYIKSDGTIQTLWAKSYYQKILESAEEINNSSHYINNNRKKHHLQELSVSSIKIIKNLTDQNITDGFTRRKEI